MVVTIKRRPEAGQRFPFIPLPRALERARELYKVANAHEVPFATAVSAWGYSEKSSGGAQTAAALKAFGLLDDVGANDIRKVKLTDTALRIIRDPRDISPDREALVREAAVRPPLHKEVLEKYQGMPPSDEALKAYLLLDRGLKEESVPDFMREFAVTMAYAGGTPSATIQDMDQEPEADMIARRVAAFTPPPPSAIQRKLQELLNHPPRPQVPTTVDPPGTRREVFGLDEGDVVLTFPENLSAESYEDLEAHLQLFLRKAKRRVSAEKRGQEVLVDPKPN